MERSVEALKQVNLVEFLSRQYGLEFRRRGATFACRSPFTEDSKPSFFVRLVKGHWLFKDYSSGAAGTIFDFVWMKERLGSFAEAFSFVRRLLFGTPASQEASAGDRGLAGSEAPPEAARPYDVEALYEQFRREDPGVCRQYLLSRGIGADLVEEMIGDGTVVHNRYGGRSWCTFAVRDEAGRLRCLDNHAVQGSGKFVLGVKVPFSREWGELRQAKEVFLAEGIIDYLSVKTIETSPPPGLALLGNQLIFEESVLEGAEVLVAALDDDRGGMSAVLDLKIMYPDKDVRIYDLEGHKDPNEFLMAVRSGKGRKLSPKRKLQLYREFQQCGNKAELAARWGIDRSHLYEIVRDVEDTLVESFSERKVGRPPKGMPGTLAEAHKRIRELERQYDREATKREELYCRNELMAIRLKWAEIEAAEARGEKVDEAAGVKKKPQVKKKEKQETLLRIDELVRNCGQVSKDWLMSLTSFSRSQIYRWQRGKQLERKARECKAVPEATVEAAAAVVAQFPHFGGRKGQAYMLYHELGYIGMRAYDRIKRNVKRLLGQEVSQRKLLPAREFYEHVRAERPGEIWAEDFTDVTVAGRTFEVALLLDTHDSYYLGSAVDSRATAELVARPIEEALEKTGGKGPEKFLLSDNGSQYISEAHGQLLTSAEIVHRRIPACVPQYNGCVEGGMRELKSVIYNVWERRVREKADEEKSLLERVEVALGETVRLMNEEIPRPSLLGVTPADVHNGNQEAKRQKIRAYRAKESARRDVPAWTRSYWEVLKSAVNAGRMTSEELLTKLAFFCRRPLRIIARRNRECVVGLPVPIPLRE